MEIVKRNAFKIIGIQIKESSDYLHTVVPPAMKELYNRCTEIPNRIDPNFMEISLGHEGDIYTQLLCVEVYDITKIPEGMFGIEIPAGNYLRYPHIGPVHKIRDSFVTMRKWADENLYQTDGFTIDYGYSPNEKSICEHYLYIKIFGRAH